MPSASETSESFSLAGRGLCAALLVAAAAAQCPSAAFTSNAPPAGWVVTTMAVTRAQQAPTSATIWLNTAAQKIYLPLPNRAPSTSAGYSSAGLWSSQPSNVANCGGDGWNRNLNMRTTFYRAVGLVVNESTGAAYIDAADQTFAEACGSGYSNFCSQILPFGASEACNMFVTSPATYGYGNVDLRGTGLSFPNSIALWRSESHPADLYPMVTFDSVTTPSLATIKTDGACAGNYLQNNRLPLNELVLLACSASPVSCSAGQQVLGCDAGSNRRCAPCEAGTFQASAVSSWSSQPCSACPAGTVSAAGASECGPPPSLTPTQSSTSTSSASASATPTQSMAASASASASATASAAELSPSPSASGSASTTTSSTSSATSSASPSATSSPSSTSTMTAAAAQLCTPPPPSGGGTWVGQAPSAPVVSCGGGCAASSSETWLPSCPPGAHAAGSGTCSYSRSCPPNTILGLCTSCASCGYSATFSGAGACVACPAGTFKSATDSSTVCSACPLGMYSYIGTSSCAPCPPGAALVSAALGCRPSESLTAGPSDTAFYLSGSQAEGVAALSGAETPDGVSFSRGVFGEPSGSLTLASGGRLSISPPAGSPLLAALPTGDAAWSASMWCRCEGGSAAALLSWGGADSQGGGAGGAPLEIASAPGISALCDSVWHHVALVHAAGAPGEVGTTAAYLDGALGTPSGVNGGLNPRIVVNPAQTYAIPSDGSASLSLGSRPGRPFAGSLAELRIYRRALSSAEVAALSQPPLLAVAYAFSTPAAPLFSSSFYLFSCAAGSAGASKTLYQDASDGSWAWLGGVAPVCAPCAAGTIAPSSSSAACTYCPPGTYSLAGAVACTLCPAGTYGAQAGLTTAACSGVCASCPTGSTAPASPSGTSGTSGGGSSGGGVAECAEPDSPLDLRLLPRGFAGTSFAADAIVASERSCALLKARGAAMQCSSEANAVVELDGLSFVFVDTAAKLGIVPSESCDGSISAVVDSAAPLALATATATSSATMSMIATATSSASGSGSAFASTSASASATSTRLGSREVTPTTTTSTSGSVTSSWSALSSATSSATPTATSSSASAVAARPPAQAPSSTSYVCASTSQAAIAFTAVGTTTWTVPAGVTSVDVLVVAGGGGGGGTSDRTAGGGGAGGLICQSGFSVTSGAAIPVTVGAGGAGGFQSPTSAQTSTSALTLVGSNGGDSVFGSLRAIGGGGGGGSWDEICQGGCGPVTSGEAARSGGSGGGVCHNAASGSGAGLSIAYNGVPGTPGQGNSGGARGYDSGYNTFAGSGGGGAGAAGASASSTTCGGAGGAGATCSMLSNSPYFAGGGGGSTQMEAVIVGCVAGAGGIGGGADGALFEGRSATFSGSGSDPSGAIDGPDGTANTGGGGGGGATTFRYVVNHVCAPGHCGHGGAGGSGIILVCAK